MEDREDNGETPKSKNKVGEAPTRCARENEAGRLAKSNLQVVKRNSEPNQQEFLRESCLQMSIVAAPNLQALFYFFK